MRSLLFALSFEIYCLKLGCSDKMRTWRGEVIVENLLGTFALGLMSVVE